MKSQSRSFTRTTVAIIIAAIVLSLGLVAGCGHHRFHDKAFWGHGKKWTQNRFHDKDLPGYIIKRMDGHVEKLELSPIQKGKYEELRTKLKANLSKTMEDRKSLFEELQAEINRETPDINVLASLVKKRLHDSPGSMEENLDLFVDFYNILDEDQKTDVINMMRKRVGNPIF